MFQVVPPCGGHQNAAQRVHSRTRFKSCPRVGGILVAVDDVKVVHSFKSCPRVGGIQGKPVICMTMIVSSRAPVWGASYFNRNYVAPRTVSSRAPVWGASLPARWR